MALPSSTAVAGDSFAQAVQAALERHPEYPLHASRRQVGAGYRQQADSLLGGDPEISVLAKSDALGSDDGYREYEAGLSLPLWLPGQRDARRGIGESIDSEATGELRFLSWKVAGETLERAWALRLAGSEAAQSERQWESARQLENDVRRRFKAGELARADLLLAQQESLDREATYQEALATLKRERAAWQSYTGWIEAPADLERVEPLSAAPPGRHPRLLAAIGRTDTARARTRDVRIGRHSAPVLTLYAKRDRGIEADPYNNSVGAEISLAFGNAAHAAPRIAEAEAALTEVQVSQAAVQRELELRREQAQQSLEQAGRSLELARQREKLARSRTALTQRAFELGESDLYLLLVARQQSAAAARTLERSRLEKQRAIARYNHTLGEIPQ
jgi:cobalt-zinc-cadmium efflux system outer membrane protein